MDFIILESKKRVPLTHEEMKEVMKILIKKYNKTVEELVEISGYPVETIKEMVKES